MLLGPAGCGAQGWCENEGADNVSQRTNSWRDNKNEWAGFGKELRREHRHFWRGLELLNAGGKKIKKASAFFVFFAHIPALLPRDQGLSGALGPAVVLPLLGSIPEPGCGCWPCQLGQAPGLTRHWVTRGPACPGPPDPPGRSPRPRPRAMLSSALPDRSRGNGPGSGRDFPLPLGHVLLEPAQVLDLPGCNFIPALL